MADGMNPFNVFLKWMTASFDSIPVETGLPLRGLLFLCHPHCSVHDLAFTHSVHPIHFLEVYQKVNLMLLLVILIGLAATGHFGCGIHTRRWLLSESTWDTACVLILSASIPALQTLPIDCPILVKTLDNEKKLHHQNGILQVTLQVYISFLGGATSAQKEAWRFGPFGCMHYELERFTLPFVPLPMEISLWTDWVSSHCTNKSKITSFPTSVQTANGRLFSPLAFFCHFLLSNWNCSSKKWNWLICVGSKK